MQSSDTNQSNLDYAQEWIRFLRRRNFVLNIIWPSLLIATILTAGMTVYFYQISQSSQLTLELESNEKTELLEQNTQLESNLSELTLKKNELEAELAALISAREELSAKNDNSASKLTITSQMVDNLNQVVSELKNERESLVAQINEQQSLISELQEEHQTTLAKTQQEKLDSLSALSKELNQRKSAYQALANRQQEMREEIDRLSNLTTTKDKQLEKLNQEKNNLASRLKDKTNDISRYQSQIDTLQKSYADLEVKLNALVSPINSSQAKPKTPQQNTLAKPNKGITGFEEIKKPVKKEPDVNESGGELDFNTISILP